MILYVTYHIYSHQTPLVYVMMVEYQTKHQSSTSQTDP